MIEIDGINKIRKYFLLGTLISAGVTILVLNLSASAMCWNSDLPMALWVIFGIHTVSFFFLLSHYIGLGKYLKRINIVVQIYYTVAVCGLFLVNYVYFHAEDCNI